MKTKKTKKNKKRRANKTGALRKKVGRHLCEPIKMIRHGRGYRLKAMAVVIDGKHGVNCANGRSGRINNYLVVVLACLIVVVGCC